MLLGKLNMNKFSRSFKLFTLPFLLLFTQQGLMAHHSAIAFDKTKSVTVSGKITRSVWRNPHMAINIEVPGDTDDLVLWKIEGPGTTILAGKGFNKKMLMDATKSSENITVVMHPLRSGKPGGLLQRITLASGNSYQVGEEYQDATAGEQERIIPSLVEWTPPPKEETWQEREAKTRPKNLPLVASDARQTGLGALDPENLNKKRPPVPFDLTGILSFR